MVQPTTRPPKTAQDYLALPDDVRAELIAGGLYVTPAPRTDHQRVIARLMRMLHVEVEAAFLGEIFLSPVDVHLPTGDIVQPDLVLVLREQAAMVREDAIHGAPGLLIEVLSPSHPERDRIVKRDRYALSGVAEYWIVDPAARSVEVFVLEEGRLEPRGWFTAESNIVSPSLPRLRLSARRIFP